MERFYLKSGEPVDFSMTPCRLVEVTAADSLRSRYFAEETTQKRGAQACNVFQRLQQDSQTRIKLKEPRPPTKPMRQVERKGPPIEETLWRRHLETQKKMEVLKAQREEEEMKEVQPAPRISEHSRALAERRAGSGSHSRCSLYESITSPRSCVTPSLNSTMKGRRSPAFDTSVISSKLSKYSDLMLPDEWLPEVGKDERGDEEETPLELAEQEAASPPPAPEVKQKSLSLVEVQEGAEPMEMPDTQSTSIRNYVSDSTVSRERALEYQKMVKRHLELIKQKPQFS